MTTLLQRLRSWMSGHDDRPEAPWHVWPDAEFLKLGDGIDGSPIVVSELGARKPITVCGPVGASRDALLLSMLASTMARGGGGILVRRAVRGSVYRAVEALARRHKRLDDLHFLDFRMGRNRRGDRSPASASFNPFDVDDFRRLRLPLVGLVDEAEREQMVPVERGRIAALIEAVLGVTDWIRKQKVRAGFDIRTFADCLDLKCLIDYANLVMPPEMPQKTVAAYLTKLPGYDPDAGYDQPKSVFDAHRLIERSIVKHLRNFADFYPHIFLRDQSDIDLRDVVRTGGILIVELPPHLDDFPVDDLQRFILALLSSELAHAAASPMPSRPPFLCMLEGVVDHKTELASMAVESRALGTALVLSGAELYGEIPPDCQLAHLLQGAGERLFVTTHALMGALSPDSPWKLGPSYPNLNQVLSERTRKFEIGDFVLVSNSRLRFGYVQPHRDRGADSKN